MLSWVNIIKIYTFICRWSYANLFTHNAIEYERYNHLYTHVSKRTFLRWITAKNIYIYTVLLAEIFICILISNHQHFSERFFSKAIEYESRCRSIYSGIIWNIALSNVIRFHRVTCKPISPYIQLTSLHHYTLQQVYSYHLYSMIYSTVK